MPNHVYARPFGRQWIDFDPNGSELWVVDAPAWRSPGSIDPQSLPGDCRFVSDQEWAYKDDDPRKYNDEDMRLTDCCGSASTFHHDEVLCCKTCWRPVPHGQGDGLEYRPACWFFDARLPGRRRQTQGATHMRMHDTSHRCPICHADAEMTTEYGWFNDHTCTATLRCPDCDDDRAIVCRHKPLGPDDEWGIYGTAAMAAVAEQVAREVEELGFD